MAEIILDKLDLASSKILEELCYTEGVVLVEPDPWGDNKFSIWVSDKSFEPKIKLKLNQTKITCRSLSKNPKGNLGVLSDLQKLCDEIPSFLYDLRREESLLMDYSGFSLACWETKSNQYKKILEAFNSVELPNVCITIQEMDMVLNMLREPMALLLSGFPQKTGFGLRAISLDIHEGLNLPLLQVQQDLKERTGSSWWKCHPHATTICDAKLFRDLSNLDFYYRFLYL